MNVLVDTSVWSLALRRTRPVAPGIVDELKELIHEGRVEIIGPIRQELLSGLKNEPQFLALREHLRAFPDLPLDRDDFEGAATCFNRCRSAGVQGSNTDFLICAVAARRSLPVFTVDKDFTAFAAVLGFALHDTRFPTAHTD
jgi:predicted nucleic acid-binding protein